MTGEEFKAWRLERHFTQTDLAARLHTTRQTVAHWEKYETVPAHVSAQLKDVVFGIIPLPRRVVIEEALTPLSRELAYRIVDTPEWDIIMPNKLVEALSNRFTQLAEYDEEVNGTKRDWWKTATKEEKLAAGFSAAYVDMEAHYSDPKFAERHKSLRYSEDYKLAPRDNWPEMIEQSRGKN